MHKKNEDVRLIPYTVKTIRHEVDVIPKGVEMIQAQNFWDKGFTGKDIVVAVIDTGIDRNHGDLKHNIIGGYNFTNEGGATDYQDHNGHGTHVAGVISGAKNKVGIQGVAPGSKILALKALDKNGAGSFQGIINAIRYAIQWRGPNGEKVRIINMSLGGAYPIPEMEKAVNDAVAEQIAVVVASGNEGDDNEETHEFAYPAHYNPVISVSACDYDKNLAPFSNNNDQVDVLAPGVDVLSTWIGGQYATISGTSMATPHVTGALALILEKGEKEWNRNFTESELFAGLAKYTLYLGHRRTSEGFGLVQLGYMDKVQKLVEYIELNFS